MKTSDTSLQDQIKALGPWHHTIELCEGVWTGTERSLDHVGSRPRLVKPAQRFDAQISKALPDGLQGRSFLDCACNGGGYCFAAKDRGAGRVLGFDIREHWINQAMFVAETRQADSSGIEFKVADLLDLGSLDEMFDVTWFSGLFYHLPDPVTGLKLAADRTRELILVSSACAWLQEGESEVPSLQYKWEGTEQVMSGVYNLSWHPSGPQVLKNVLKWMGFPEARTVSWVQKEKTEVKSERHRFIGRVAVLAAREPGRLDEVSDIDAPNFK